MLQSSIIRLEYLIQVIPDLLSEIDERTFSLQPAPNKWSKKQIIGHLIDSATNNHHRFVRGQFEDEPEIRYDQDKWNACGFYQHIGGTHIIAFWKLYNRQLLEIVKRIPEGHLSRKVRVGEELHSLDFLIIDYVRHLEHHLKQVVNY